MKLPRRLVAVLVVVAVVLAALTLAARFLLPVDRFVMAALADLRARTGAAVTVGDSRVDLWPTPRVVLAGVGAHGTGADLDAAGVSCRGLASWTLAMKSVTARPDWGELVHGRAALRDVRLDSPRLEWVAESPVPGGVPASRAEADAASIAPLPGLLRVRLDGARWNGIEASVTAELTGWPATGRLRGEWRLDRCDPSALLAALPRRPALAGTPVERLEAGRVEAEGDFDWPWPLPQPLRFRDLAPGLSGRAEVSDLSVTFAGSAVPWVVQAAADLQASRLEVREAVVGIGAGKISGSVTLSDLDREAPHCAFEANCEDVALADLLRVLAPGATAYVEGTAGAALSGSLVVGPSGRPPAGLAVAGKVELREGIVHAQSWLSEIVDYLGERRDLQDIRYRTLAAGIELREGRLSTEDLKLEGPDTDWRGSGWLDFAGPLDLGLVVKLPAGFRPDLGSMTPYADLLKGDDGRIALGLRLTGRASAPDVNLDLATSGRQADRRNR